MKNGSPEKRQKRKGKREKAKPSSESAGLLVVSVQDAGI
jgi:hypothetical protein